MRSYRALLARVVAGRCEGRSAVMNPFQLDPSWSPPHLCAGSSGRAVRHIICDPQNRSPGRRSKDRNYTIIAYEGRIHWFNDSYWTPKYTAVYLHADDPPRTCCIRKGWRSRHVRVRHSTPWLFCSAPVGQAFWAPGLLHKMTSTLFSISNSYVFFLPPPIQGVSQPPPFCDRNAECRRVTK